MKHKFWIGVGAAVLVLLVLYVVVVIPKKALVSSNVEDLDTNSKKLKQLSKQGVEIANDNKIELAEKTADKLEKQFETILNGFEDTSSERVRFWPGIKASGKVNGGLFKDRYEQETRALENMLLDKKVQLSDRPFEWVDYGERVPSAEECVPVMRDFRIIEDLVDMMLKSGALRSIHSVKLQPQEVVVLTVRDEIAFYSRPCQIEIDVIYSRLPELLAALNNSEKKIMIENLSLVQLEDPAVRPGEELPIGLELTCGTLRRGPMPETEEEF